MYLNCEKLQLAEKCRRFVEHVRIISVPRTDLVAFVVAR